MSPDFGVVADHVSLTPGGIRFAQDSVIRRGIVFGLVCEPERSEIFCKIDVESVGGRGAFFILWRIGSVRFLTCRFLSIIVVA